MYFSKKILPVKLIALLILLSFAQSVLAQNDSISSPSSYFFQPTIQVDYLYGQVNDPNELEGINNSHYGKISLLNKTGNQPGSFFKRYGSPQVGLSFLVGYLGKRDVYGSVIGVYPTWSYHFKEENSLSFDVTLGSGLAFFSRPFNKIDNPDNLLIGSHVTNITDISTHLVFRFHPNVFIRTGIGLVHASNAHTAIPNIGLDDITVRLGMVYKPGVLTGLEMPKRKSVAPDTLWRKNIRVLYGRHELAFTQHPVDGPSYTIFGLAGYVSKQLSPINEFQFGLSYVYYNSYHTLISFDEMYSHFKFIRSSVISLHVAHEFLIHHFGFVTDFGLKIYDPIYRNFFLAHDESITGWFKHYVGGRVGFEFYPYNTAFSAEKLSLGAYLKTNLFQADYLEFNITYTF